MSDRARELAVLDEHLASAGVREPALREAAQRAFDFDRYDRPGEMVKFAAQRAVASALAQEALSEMADEGGE